MECNIVLAHKHVQLNLRLILPPRLPLIGVISGNRDVPDWGIKPNIENFVFVSVERYWGAPLKVASDTSALESSFEHRVRKAHRVGRPVD